MAGKGVDQAHVDLLDEISRLRKEQNDLERRLKVSLEVGACMDSGCASLDEARAEVEKVNRHGQTMADWAEELLIRAETAEADNARLRNDCGDLTAEINRLCGEIRQLQLSVEMACVEPPGDCECPGCAYAAKANADPSQSPTDCGK